MGPFWRGYRGLSGTAPAQAWHGTLRLRRTQSSYPPYSVSINRHHASCERCDGSWQVAISHSTKKNKKRYKIVFPLESHRYSVSIPLQHHVVAGCLSGQQSLKTRSRHESLMRTQSTRIRAKNVICCIWESSSTSTSNARETFPTSVPSHTHIERLNGY